MTNVEQIQGWRRRDPIDHNDEIQGSFAAFRMTGFLSAWILCRSPLMLLVGCCVVFCAACLGQQAGPVSPEASFHLHNQQFVVKLLSPLSTKTSKPGDTFTAFVVEPQQFQGGVMEGRITTLKKPENGLGKGKSEILFEFDTLTYSGQTAKVSAEVHDVANSKGAKSVDEEGNVIGKSSNKKRFLGTVMGAGAGAALGAMAGGGTGAIVGAVAGGAAGLAISITMTTTASDIEFKPGSQFTLIVSDAGKNKKL